MHHNNIVLRNSFRYFKGLKVVSSFRLQAFFKLICIFTLTFFFANPNKTFRHNFLKLKKKKNFGVDILPRN